MDDYQFSVNFGHMLAKARKDAGQTRSFMARACGVSIKTVQNWEEGFSFPNAKYQFKWFKVLGKQPLPYYLMFLYPDIFSSKNTYLMSDDEVNAALHSLINDLPSETKRDLLYILRSEHGSSPVCVIKMIVLHLSYPIKERIGIAKAIINNHILYSESHALPHNSNTEIDLKLVEAAIDRCTQAVKDGDECYTSILHGLSPNDKNYKNS